MAEMVSKSESRFSVLYQEFFGIGAVKDLVNVRLEKACWLLTNRYMSIAEVAHQSGFENIYYFSRLFKLRIGCTPSQYYQRFALSKNS